MSEIHTFGAFFAEDQQYYFDSYIKAINLVAGGQGVKLDPILHAKSLNDALQIIKDEQKYQFYLASLDANLGSGSRLVMMAKPCYALSKKSDLMSLHLVQVQNLSLVQVD